MLLTRFSDSSSPCCHGVRLIEHQSNQSVPQDRGLSYQYTHRISFPAWLLAHCSKHSLCKLFPHAARHQTMSSVSGSNSVKQIGQSPEASLRLEGASEEADVADDAGAGAAAKISCSSLKSTYIQWWSTILRPDSDLQRRERQVDIVDFRGL